MSLRSLIRTIPGATEVYGAIHAGQQQRLMDLEVFVPNSAGPAGERLKVAVADANRAFPFLVELLSALGRSPPSITPIESFPRSTEEREAGAQLAALFERYGSDKSGAHDYYHLYGAILARAHIGSLLEIGLGTNNEDVLSNMGAQGRPGASLRAFRDYLPEARIYGADIDRRVLFAEERIQTFYVDQLDLGSFDELSRQTPEQLDLVIDDGLHSPAANIAVLTYAARKQRAGGWVVIEDIVQAALPVWQVVAQLLDGWACQIIQARSGFMFVANRPPTMA